MHWGTAVSSIFHSDVGLDRLRALRQITLRQRTLGQSGLRQSAQSVSARPERTIRPIEIGPAERQVYFNSPKVVITFRLATR